MMIGFGLMDALFPLVFGVVFFGILALFVATLVRGLTEKRKNDNSPRLTMDAVVVAKRTDVTDYSMPVSGGITGAHGYHHTTDTDYYATFEVKSGDRLELSISGAEYGQLAEGDRGELTVQGTRYLGFERNV